MASKGVPHSMVVGLVMSWKTNASSLVLVLDELLPVFPLLVRVLLEVGREPAVSDVISVKVVSHGHVDVGGVQLQIDLLVDQGLAVLLVVLPDAGSHLQLLVDSSAWCVTMCWLSLGPLWSSSYNQQVWGMESYSPC